MKVLQYIYVVWASVLFIGTLFVAFLFLMLGRLLPGRARHRFSNTVLSWWATLWVILIGMPITAHNRDRSWGKTPMVLITNHGSYLDTVASYITAPHLFKTLAKKELLKIPIMGSIFLTSGIMVDRSSPESRKASFQRMVDAVRSGTSILIYPEGTQNRTPEPLQNFYDGAFKLAVEAQVPILPIATINARWLMPQAKIWELRPGRIRQFYLDPVPTTGLTLADVPALKEKIHADLEQVLRREDPKFS